MGIRCLFFAALTAHISVAILRTGELTDEDVTVETKILSAGVQRVTMVVKDGELVAEEIKEDEEKLTIAQHKEVERVTSEQEANVLEISREELDPPTSVWIDETGNEQRSYVTPPSPSKPPLGTMMQRLRDNMQTRMVEKEASMNEVTTMHGYMVVAALDAAAERAALLDAIRGAKLGQFHQDETGITTPSGYKMAHLGDGGGESTVRLYDGLALRLGLDRSNSLAFAALSYIPVDAVLFGSVMSYGAGLSFGVGMAAFALRARKS